MGVTQVYGLDHPEALEENTGLQFVAEHSMTPDELTAALKGTERRIFRAVYGGGISKKMYRLYEFASGQEMKNNIGALTN